MPGYFGHGLFGQGDQIVVEGNGLYAPETLPLDGDILLRGDAGRRLLGGVEHARQYPGVEGALVEGHLTPPVEGGNDGGAYVDEARGGAHVVAVSSVVAERYRGAGRRDESVSPYFHRRGARVGVLAGEADGVPLDAEGAEHHPERPGPFFPKP